MGETANCRLDRLDPARGKMGWGYACRFGLVAVSEANLDVLVEASISSAHAGTTSPAEP